jgi:hypothetical protein
MAITVTCSSCGKTLQAKEEWAGKNVRCPGCQSVLTVPGLKAKGTPPPMPAPARAAAAAAPRRARDDEDDRPPARRRRDEDDEAPRRKSGGGSGAYDKSEIQLSKLSVISLFIPIWSLITLIQLYLVHSKLPKVRDDDPSGGKAIGFMFIPIYNFFWMFFVWLRLMDRLNEAREVVGQEPDLPRGLMKGSLITMVVSIPLIFCFGLGAIGVIAGGIMQLIALIKTIGAINEIVDAVEG